MSLTPAPIPLGGKRISKGRFPGIRTGLLAAAAVGGALQAAAPAVVDTRFVNPGPLPVGQEFQVEVGVTQNTQRIGAFMVAVVYTKAAFDKVGRFQDGPDFSSVESAPEDLGSEVRVKLGGVAMATEGAPPDAVLFTATFRVLAPDCAAAVRVVEYPNDPNALTDNDTFEPIPTTFNSAATQNLFEYTATGDLTGDGQRTQADVQRLRDILLRRVLPDAQAIYGDMNANCELDPGDLLRIAPPAMLIAEAEKRWEFAQIVDDGDRAQFK